MTQESFRSKYTLFIRLFILITGLCAYSFTHAQQSVQVKSHDGLLSIQAADASARQVAEELSRTLGINVVLTGDDQTRLDIDISEEPLDKAIARLSPNNLLVRESASPESPIIEVVLMLADNSTFANTSAESQFLPSGAPAPEVFAVESINVYPEQVNPQTLRDPNRIDQVRQSAISSAFESNMPPEQLPPMITEDPMGPDSDPLYTQPYQQP
ncbi:MAG: hypothetical protein KTR32_20525 [Granulosicoccus sp.]|nr:hypothetical protein [Granulosicoccus sp.]